MQRDAKAIVISSIPVPTQLTTMPTHDSFDQFRDAWWSARGRSVGTNVMGVNAVLLILCALLAILIYLLFRSTNFIALLLAMFGWSRLQDTEAGVEDRSLFGGVPYKNSYQNECSSQPAYQLSPQWSSSASHDVQSTPNQSTSPIADERESHESADAQIRDFNPPTMVDVDLHLKLSPNETVLCSEDDDNEKTDFRSLRRAISTESVGSSLSAITTYGDDDPSIQITVSYERTEQMFRTQLSRLFDPPQCTSLYLIFYLLPHPKPLWRTEARSITMNPVVFEQCFHQCIRCKDVNRVALLVQLYVEKECVRLAGQCRIRLRDTVLQPPSTLYLTLKDEKQDIQEEECSLGEILFSLFYQHDRLSIVIMKLRGLEEWINETMVRIYVVQSGGRVLKKKTSIQSVHDRGTVFNESVFINVSKAKIVRSSIRLSVVEVSQLGARSIGHVTIGPKTSGKEFGHFQRMLSSQDRPVCMWHNIKPKNKAI
ncbi:Synaptotagmin-12 [Toxocara canis]|uniref:Synaptotagmin-12 n=1 Tax=Toxocara canis TaxID=6265 RepID=A0A0B2V703_TOXCA|nr:Synaptotagmin-12 [Toxocara canis]